MTTNGHPNIAVAPIDSVKSQRYPGIDVAKGIGIILVVLGHNWILHKHAPELMRIVYSFHVPLFFFISGLFLEAKTPLVDLARRRFGLLLKPYFVVLGIVLVSEVIIRGNFNADSAFGIIYGSGQTISWTPLWFLPHLYLALLVCTGLLKILGARLTKPVFTVATLLALLAIGQLCLNYAPNISLLNLSNSKGMNVNVTDWPFSADLLPVSCTFMIVGHILAPKVKHLTFNPVACILAIVVFMCCQVVSVETMNLNGRIFGNPVISTIQAAAGIFITFSLAALISERNMSLKIILSLAGSGSLFILIFHGILQGSAIAKTLSLTSDQHEVAALIGVLSGIFFPQGILYLTKRIRLLRVMLLPSR